MLERALAIAAAAILLAGGVLSPRAALADGELRAVYADGGEKVYPGLKVVNAKDAIYFIDTDAHQMVIVLKSGCSKQGALDLCTGTSVTWDRYGVRTDLDASQVSLYLNVTTKAHGIKDSAVTLTPNTLRVEIVTGKGTHITGIGYVDSTQTP
jgi:hypothetical protein